MTFKCDLCAETSEPRTKMHKVVANIRDVQYVNPGNAQDVIATGFETVNEVKLCDICFKDVNEVIT